MYCIGNITDCTLLIVRHIFIGTVVLFLNQNTYSGQKLHTCAWIPCRGNVFRIEKGKCDSYKFNTFIRRRVKSSYLPSYRNASFSVFSRLGRMDGLTTGVALQHPGSASRIDQIRPCASRVPVAIQIHAGHEADI